MKACLLVAAGLALLLAACGEDAPGRDVRLGLEGRPDVGGKGTGDRREAMERALATGLDLELDEEAMGAFLAVHGRVLAARGEPRTAMRAASGDGWDWMRYGKALIKWQAMQEATRKGAAGVQREIDQMNEQGEALEARLAGAAGAERTHLANMLEAHESMRSTFEEGLEAIKRLDTPEVRALVERWKPRFDALDRELGQEFD